MSVLPTRDNERIGWSINFEAKFADFAAGLGFTAGEVTSLTAASAAMRFGISVAQEGRGFLEDLHGL